MSVLHVSVLPLGYIPQAHEYSLTKNCHGWGWGTEEVAEHFTPHAALAEHPVWVPRPQLTVV